VRLKRFISVGLVATLAYAILATLAHSYLPFSAGVSSGLAYAVCALGSWFGHRLITFQDVQPHKAGPLVFFAISASGHALSVIIPTVLSDTYGLSTSLSTLMTCTVIPLVSAILTSRLVYGVSLFEKRLLVTTPTLGQAE
jgi:putative flippase GtrA